MVNALSFRTSLMILPSGAIILRYTIVSPHPGSSYIVQDMDWIGYPPQSSLFTVDEYLTKRNGNDFCVAIISISMPSGMQSREVIPADTIGIIFTGKGPTPS